MLTATVFGAILIGGDVLCGVLVGVLMLAVAGHLALAGMFETLLPSQLVFFFILTMSVPFSCYLAGVLLDYFSFEDKNFLPFQKIALLSGFVLLFRSDIFFQYLEALAAVYHGGEPVKIWLLFSHLIAAILFCGALVAFVYMVLAFLFELPGRWLLSCSGRSLPVFFESLRPFIVILLIAVSAELILGLFLEELSPNKLFINP